MSMARYARRAITVLYRRAGLVALCTLAGGVAAMAWALNEPRVYVVAAKVALRASPQSDPSFVPAGAAESGIEAEMALLRARGGARAVVEKYAIREDQLVRGGDAWPRLEAVVAHDRRSRAVDMFLDDLSIARSPRANAEPAAETLELKFECADRVLAPLALRSLLDHYLQAGAQRDRRLAETRAALLDTLLSQAADDLRRREDDVVALLVRDGRRATGRGLRLDLDMKPPAARTDGAAPPPSAASGRRASALPLRLDDSRQTPLADAGRAYDARLELVAPPRHVDAAMPVKSAFEADLARLDAARQRAQARLASLRHELEQIDLFLHQDPADAEARVVVEAPDRLKVVEVGDRRHTGLLGAAAGLLLGLLWACVREKGGGRLRSPREAERALGVPVLGAIPTLSAKARDAYLGLPWSPRPLAGPACA
jgi:hypothetical protein